LKVDTPTEWRNVILSNCGIPPLSLALSHKGRGNI
jgi:hypothetical protein